METAAIFRLLLLPKKADFQEVCQLIISLQKVDGQKSKNFIYPSAWLHME